MPTKAKGDKKIEMEKEEEENEDGGAETTMKIEVQAAVAAEMGKVHATIKDGIDHMMQEIRSSLSAEMGRELDKRDQQRDQRMEQRFEQPGGASEAGFGETQQNLSNAL